MTYLKPNKWFYSLAAFILIFCIRFPMIHLEIDVNDEGYHLINQQLSSIIGIQYAKMNPIWWFSDVVGSLWLKLTDPFGLWGARVGGVIGNCLVGMIAIQILSLVYKPHLALLLAVGATALYSQPGRILYYDSVPEIFFVIFAFFFLKMTLDSSKRLYPILSGLSLACLILAKWPMLACITIPPLAFLGSYYIDKNKARTLIRPYLHMLITTFSAIALIFSYLFYNQVLSDYLFTHFPSPNHTFSFQLTNWFQLLKNKIPLLILFFGIPFAFYKLLAYKKIKYREPLAILLFLSLFLISRVYSIFHAPKWYFPFMYQSSTYILMYFLLVISCAACIYILKNVLKTEEYVLFLLAILFPLFQSLGSAIGISKVYMGMWLLSGLMFCLFQQVANRFPEINYRIPLHLLGAILMLNIFYSGIKYSFYQSENRSELTAEFESERLKGIYTAPERKESFDSLIGAITKYTTKGDRILTYEYFPLAYFASDTLPFANRSAWVWLPTPILTQKIEEFSKFPPPALIVRSKTDTQYPRWGLKPLALCENTDPKHRAFILSNMETLDRAIERTWKTELVWSNPDFDVYQVTNK